MNNFSSSKSGFSLSQIWEDTSSTEPLFPTGLGLASLFSNSSRIDSQTIWQPPLSQENSYTSKEIKESQTWRNSFLQNNKTENLTDNWQTNYSDIKSNQNSAHGEMPSRDFDTIDKNLRNKLNNHLIKQTGNSTSTNVDLLNKVSFY